MCRHADSLQTLKNQLKHVPTCRRAVHHKDQKDIQKESGQYSTLACESVKIKAISIYVRKKAKTFIILGYLNMELICFIHQTKKCVNIFFVSSRGILPAAKPVLEGYPSPIRVGVPQSCPGQGVPQSWPGGYPSPVLVEGYPSPGLGVTPVLS